MFLLSDAKVLLSFCLGPHSGDFDQAVEMMVMSLVSRNASVAVLFSEDD